MATKHSPKAANATAPATTAPQAKQALANATAPATANEIALLGMQGNTPVTKEMVQAFINGKAGGNAALVNIVPLPNVNPNAANPLPFSRMQPANGKRAQILWALVKGTPIQGGGTTRSLAAFLAYSGKIGASQQNPLDLLAALNGGFSRSSKTWGTPFVKLVLVNPPQAPANNG